MKLTYEEFLKRKELTVNDSGFEISESELNNNLFAFQKYIVKTALKKGKFGIFADCGLGKTAMQLEWAFKVSKQTKGKVLILVPLAVKAQTIQEAKKFKIDISSIDIYNYEQISNIDCSIYSGIVLDESSILKNFEGKTKQSIIENFSHTSYKLACTATPSPNDPMELGNHSEFLNVMSRDEMLAMYFIHDGMDTSKWRLKKHSQNDFWKFVSKWAIFISHPKDIGFDSVGYDLPKLNIIEDKINVKTDDLFDEESVNALEFNKKLKETMLERLEKTAKIVNENKKENFIIWIKLNEEGDILKKLIPEAKEVKGSDSNEYKEKTLLGFANNEFRVLITKAKIAQYGLNFQNCRNQIFPSLDFSFESLYQSIRRSYRFGQKQEVNIYLITLNSMKNVIESITKKEKQFSTMKEKLGHFMNNENIELEKEQSKKYDIDEVKNEYYHIRKGDCVKLIKDVKSESVDFSVFSPPFAELYTYSDNIADMGNSKNYKEFLIQFRFLVRELYRVMASGRNVAIHCMDLPIQKGKEGYIGLRDFSGMILKLFLKEGFIYHSRITIWKSPVLEMQRTKALGLLHKQLKKDSVMSRVGSPDYIMVFRKPGENLKPIENTDISVDLWQEIASPIWATFDNSIVNQNSLFLENENGENKKVISDETVKNLGVRGSINYSNTLQGYRDGRHENDEKHICPLQLDIIERLILLYSNKGDTVLTPFMGISSEVFQAVKMGRYGIGFELKDSYYDLAKKNLDSCLKSQVEWLF